MCAFVSRYGSCIDYYWKEYLPQIERDFKRLKRSSFRSGLSNYISQSEWVECTINNFPPVPNERNTGVQLDVFWEMGSDRPIPKKCPLFSPIAGVTHQHYMTVRILKIDIQNARGECVCFCVGFRKWVLLQ